MIENIFDSKLIEIFMKLNTHQSFSDLFKSGYSYKTISKYLNIFREYNLISEKKTSGRKKKIDYSEKGIKLFNHIKEIKNLFILSNKEKK